MSQDVLMRTIVSCVDMAEVVSIQERTGEKSESPRRRILNQLLCF